MNKIDLLNKFRPSSADRILNCHKSLKYDATIEDSSNPHADRGVKLHSLSEDLYQGKDINLSSLSDKDKELVNSYVIYIKSISNNAEYSNVEEKIYLNKLSNYFKQTKYGMIDFLAIRNNKLYIIDLKTGFSYVKIKENYQLYIYAYCAYMTYNDKFNIDSFRIGTYQYGKEMFIDIGINELVEWINTNVISKLDDIFLSNDLTTNPTTPNCKWCKGKEVCESTLN